MPMRVTPRLMKDRPLPVVHPTAPRVPYVMRVRKGKPYTVLHPVRPSLAIEMAYRKRLYAMIDAMSASVHEWVLSAYESNKPHAVVLEKKCFKAWQQGVPPNAGRREVVASLEPNPGACAGQPVVREEKPAPELPNDPAQMASIGFLSLGSRPSAQVFVDGVDIGRTTPLVQWPLKVGKHKVKLVVGSKKMELAVDIRSGGTVSEIVDLRKAK